MSDYSIISDISSALVNILRDNLVPDIVQNRESILLCSPSERGDAVVTVFMYDMKEDERMQENRMMSHDIYGQRYPSIFLKLNYIISVFSAADIKYRLNEEMKIIGSVIQIFNDNFLLNPDTYEFNKDSTRNNIKIEMSRLPEDEKYKIFSLPNIPNKPSAFYTVTPVEIKSKEIKSISRVKEIGIYHYNKQESV